MRHQTDNQSSTMTDNNPSTDSFQSLWFVTASTDSVFEDSDDERNNNQHSVTARMAFDDIRNQILNSQTVLTLEELRDHYNSCYSCGVSWTEDHVSLDCFECGGYSMQRPCPVCEGKCNRLWRRDLAMSHAMQKAHWEGECGLPTEERQVMYLKNLVDVSEDSLADALQDLKTNVSPATDSI